MLAIFLISKPNISPNCTRKTKIGQTMRAQLQLCVLSVHESKIEIVHFKTTFCKDVKHGSVYHYKKAQVVLWPNTCFISLRWATSQGIYSGIQEISF